MVRNLPIALRHQFVRDRLLPFNTEWIDGIRDINPRNVGEFMGQVHAVIEISGHLQNDRAIIHTLREFRGTDLILRQ